MAPDSAKLVLDVGSIARSASGAITAIIFVQLGPLAFPEEKWSDLAPAVIRGWMEAIVALLRGGDRACDLRFLDGPFRLRLSRDKDMSWIIECFMNHAKQQRECLQQVDLEAFIASVVFAAEKLLDVCARNKWSSADLDALVHLVPAVKKLM